MLQFLPAPLIGSISILLHVVNTVIGFIILIPIAVGKILIPLRQVRNVTTKMAIFVADTWLFLNNVIVAFTKDITWDIEFTGDDLKDQSWYLIISNHQTWNDILVMMKVFHNRVPFLRYFLKKELIWVPLLGPVWWLLDFPFMQRFSKELIRKKPHLAGKDIEETRKACEKYKDMPVSIMNFVEGTRFSSEKHERQQSPYRHLLKPRAGGVSFVLDAMGDLITHIVDMTIFYPEGAKSFWDFHAGNVRQVVVRVNVFPVPSELRGDYINDAEFSQRFRDWINGIWRGKDAFLDELERSRKAQG